MMMLAGSRAPSAISFTGDWRLLDYFGWGYWLIGWPAARLVAAMLGRVICLDAAMNGDHDFYEHFDDDHRRGRRRLCRAT